MTEVLQKASWLRESFIDTADKISFHELYTCGELFREMSLDRQGLLRRFREQNDMDALRRANIIAENLDRHYSELNRLKYRQELIVSDALKHSVQYLDVYIIAAAEEAKLDGVEVDLA